MSLSRTQLTLYIETQTPMSAINQLVRPRSITNRLKEAVAAVTQTNSFYKGFTAILLTWIRDREYSSHESQISPETRLTMQIISLPFDLRDLPK
jgi:hypothetical protein